MKIYINGKFYGKEDAKISVFDHGLLYGDGVFEGIRIYNNKIFKLKEHVQRLFMSAKSIMLNMTLSPEEMEDALLEAVKLNGKKNGYIRLIVTRGEGHLGTDPGKCGVPNIIIIVDDIQLYPEEFYEKGIEIITSSIQRISPSVFDVRIKSLNYLNNVMSKLEAKQSGVLECVMLNNQGYVTECTSDNIFVVANNRLLTPFSYLGALDGITRNTIIEIAGNIGICVEEAVLTRYDLYNSDECFLTGTGAEIMPVIKIDGRIIGDGTPGKVTKMLLENFRKIIIKKSL